MGIRNPVGYGVQTEDGRGGAKIPGDIECQSSVFGMWRGNGGRVTVSESANAAWGRTGREKEAGGPSPRWRDSDILNGFTNRGGTEGIPSQGVWGAGGKEDGNMSVFYEHTCPGNSDNTEVGQPYPPTLPPM